MGERGGGQLPTSAGALERGFVGCPLQVARTIKKSRPTGGSKVVTGRRQTEWTGTTRHPENWMPLVMNQKPYETVNAAPQLWAAMPFRRSRSPHGLKKALAAALDASLRVRASRISRDCRSLDFPDPHGRLSMAGRWRMPAARALRAHPADRRSSGAAHAA